MTDIKKWNKEVLNSMGVKEEAKSQTVVRSIGDAKRATLADGTIVEREESLYIEPYGLVQCAPYELHFIYKLPKHMMGYGLMCTCGSIAGVVGYDVYSKLSAPTFSGMIIVCVRHMTLKQNEGKGRHADDSSE